MPSLPWRICARTVGNRLQAKIWNPTRVEPGWSDTNFGGSVAVPQGLATGGESGIYAGHLEPGQQLDFDNIGHF